MRSFAASAVHRHREMPTQQQRQKMRGAVLRHPLLFTSRRVGTRGLELSENFPLARSVGQRCTIAIPVSQSQQGGSGLPSAGACCVIPSGGQPASKSHQTADDVVITSPTLPSSLSGGLLQSTRRSYEGHGAGPRGDGEMATMRKSQTLRRRPPRPVQS